MASDRRMQVIVAVLLWVIGCTAAILGEDRARVARLVVHAESAQAGQMQIFIDRGQGFSERDSAIIPLRPMALTRYTVPLKAGRHHAFRIDPVHSGANRLDIRGIWIEGSLAAVIHTVPLEQLVKHNDIANLFVTPTGAVAISDATARDPSLLVDLAVPFLVPPREPSSGLDQARRFSVGFGIALLVAVVLTRWPLAGFGGRSMLVLTSLACLGTLAAAIRNPDPLFDPVFYTEDGLWLGVALTAGWPHVLLNARPDYFVVGNLLLLWLASQINWLFNGRDLALLPQLLAGVSYAFYASVAAGAYVALHGSASRTARVLLFATVLLVPVGGTLNEVYGRLSNVGYVFFFACVLLLILREKRATVGARTLAIDAVLVLCAATNPLCIAMIGGYLSYRVFQAHRGGFRKAVKPDLLLGMAVVALSLIIMVRSTLRPPIKDVLSIAPAGVAGLLEAVARSVLYPFVFPWYSSLNHGIVLFLLACWIAVLVAALRAGRSGPLAICVAGLVVSTVATLVMRPGLANLLVGYGSTFPDRYFHAQNLLSLTAFVLAIDSLSRRGTFLAAGVRSFGLGGIALVYALNLPALVEYDQPAFRISSGRDFPEQLRLVLESHAPIRDQRPAVLTVPIQPPGWAMDVPVKYVDPTLHRSPR